MQIEPQRHVMPSATLGILLMATTLLNGCKPSREGTRRDDPRLADAAEYGTVQQVKTLLEQGVYVDSLGSEDRTALYYAAVNGDAKLARLLLSGGANPNLGVEPKYGEGPLHAAAAHCNLEVARLLLDSGAEPSRASHGGITPLHMASWGGCLDIVKLLVDRGANVNAISQNHQTPLHLETLAQDITVPQSAYADVARFLIEHGADPTIPDRSGQTASARAAAMGYTDAAIVMREAEQTHR